MTDDDVSGARRQLINNFEAFCSSDDLSIDELRRRTEGTSSTDLGYSSFLHRACMNKNVTLEIVEYILEFNPSAINFRMEFNDNEGSSISAYPLHLACYNKDCPNEVIQLLLGKTTPSKTHVSHMNCDWGNTGIEVGELAFGGYPLHFYLSRTSNVDLDIVKQLVWNKRMLLSTAPDDKKCTPIHILLYNENIGDMYDVVNVATDH